MIKALTFVAAGVCVVAFFATGSLLFWFGVLAVGFLGDAADTEYRRAIEDAEFLRGENRDLSDKRRGRTRRFIAAQTEAVQ